MKWFEHNTSARNDVKLKILKKKFGAEGYGVYFQLLEIIGESIDVDNPDDWGFVDRIHSVETLADEVGVTPKKLRDILKLANELDLFQKFDGRLYCHQILNRLDTYARRHAKNVDFEARKKALIEQTSNKLRTNNEQGKTNVENSKDSQRSNDDVQTNFEQTSKNVRPHNITTHNITTQHKTKPNSTEQAQEYLDFWNEVHNKKFTSVRSVEKNLQLRLKEFSFDQIKDAVRVVKRHHFWQNKMRPETLLRNRNTQGEAVDYIGEMLNYQPASKKFDNEQNDKYEGIK